jgi:hypothetical protein
MKMEYIICLAIGFIVCEIFNIIDYKYFNYALRKRFMPNQNSIIVLDDGETWSSEAFYIQLSDVEMKRVMNDEKVYNVVKDNARWRPL